MTGIPRLETERLVLRAPAEADFPVYRAFYGNAQASHFYGGPLDEEKAWARLAADLGHWHLRGYGLWALERKADGRVLGTTGLCWLHGWPRHELTWWLLPEARGHGYATEASHPAIAFGYDTLGWPSVETYLRDENEPARRLVLRLGGEVIARETFQDGEARDVFHLPRAAHEVRATA